MADATAYAQSVMRLSAQRRLELVAKSCLLSLIATLWLPLIASGAEHANGTMSGIYLGGVELTLGMKGEVVISSLSKTYTVSGADNGWNAVITKDGPPFEYLGSIEIRDGRLASVSKSWGSFPDEEAFKLAQEIITALQGITGSREAPAIISFKEIRQPGFRSDRVDLLFGPRRLVISIHDGPRDKGGRQVSVSEELSID